MHSEKTKICFYKLQIGFKGLKNLSLYRLFMLPLAKIKDK